MTEGDFEGLIDFLAADVVVYGDGGGKAPQWMEPITGAERVARLLASLGRQMRKLDIVVRRQEINGQTGAILWSPDGEVITVFSFDIADGVVRTLRSVINPDELQHVGPVADVRAMLRQLRRG